VESGLEGGGERGVIDEVGGGSTTRTAEDGVHDRHLARPRYDEPTPRAMAGVMRIEI
jgi:hypothetical protein